MALTRVSPALFQVSNNITSVTVGGSANTISLTFDSNGVITGASNNALSVANTQLTGLIQAAQIGSANATLITSGTLPGARLPAGSVLQVAQANTQVRQVFNSGSNPYTTYHDITGLSVTITPTSSSSKFLLMASVTIASLGTAYNTYLVFDRNGTQVGVGTASPNAYSATSAFRSQSADQLASVAMCHLDSPSTGAAITYKVRVNNSGGSSYPAYINGTNSVDNTWQATPYSSITIMEIAA